MSDPVRVSLIAVFVTALVTAQILAVKVLAIPLPVDLPLLGAAIVAPGGVLAYAITFFASDCYAELYGRRPAQVVVAVGFAMNVLLLALLWIAIVVPGSSAGVDPAAFANVLGLSTNIVAGSLAAYLVSQNWDVLVFDAIARWTDGRLLWLRNVGSTATSQAIDTAIFIGVAFSLLPRFVGIGTPLPAGALVQLAVGQYLLKLLIALVDTPFVYAVVAIARSRGIGVRRATV